MLLTGVYQPVLLCFYWCKDAHTLVKCCGKDNVRSGPQLRVQLLTLSRRVKVQRTPRNDRCPLSSFQSISIHSCLSRWWLCEIVFSGMWHLWSLGVWTWKESTKKTVLLFFLLLFPQSLASCLRYFLSGVQIASDWCWEILHMWGLSEVWQHFFCVNIAAYLDQMLFSLAVYCGFIVCESLSCCLFVENKNFILFVILYTSQ